MEISWTKMYPFFSFPLSSLQNFLASQKKLKEKRNKSKDFDSYIKVALPFPFIFSLPSQNIENIEGGIEEITSRTIRRRKATDHSDVTLHSLLMAPVIIVI